VGTKYKRIKNVEDKIHSARLPYNAWKVFFLIDGSIGINKIAEYLEEDESVVDDSLQRLISEGLVETEGAAEKEKPEAEKIQEEIEEPAFEVSDEVEEPVFEMEADLQPEAEFETSETLDLDLDENLAEMKEEPISEEELAEDEPDLTDELISVVEEEGPEEELVSEEDTLTDFSLDNFNLEDTVEMTTETEADVESVAETVEEETLEIDLQDMEGKEESTEGVDLNIDFAEEEQTEVAVEEKPQPKETKPEKPSAEELADMKTILVVDDSIVIRKMVEIALEDENYKIETAVSGKDGLAILDEKNPSLMILDLMLPDINGIDLLKTVKASKGIPVIMLSGKDSPQMVEKARSEGADAFLPKPFKDDELVSKIRELLS